MNENYLIFNELGILVDSQLNEVSQGNHNVDYFYIGYYDYDYTTSYTTVAITLPNGNELPELSTSQKDFEFNNNQFKGYMFKLPETLTAIAGNLTMTIVLKNMADDTELFSSQINIQIHNTDNIIDPTITDLQYNQMQETIREEFAEINRQIESGALKGDKGDKGDKGEKGDKGDKGDTAYKTSELINDGNGVSAYATVNDVKSEISNLINSAPETLDTLGEIANAIAENEDVIEALNQAIGTKANKSDLINMVNYKGETTEDNVGDLLDAVGDLCYVTGTREYLLCVESTFENGHINKKFMPILGGIDSSKFAPYETFNDLLNNRINISNDSSGGAIGYGASAGKGFAGGQNAKTTQLMESGATRVVDAIQLGTGTNLQDRTLQVYGDNIYDANTHTAKFQNITLNGEDLNDILSGIKPEITIDTSVSSTSTNPVQNKAIYSYVQSIKNSIDYDNLQDKPITNYSSSVLDISSAAIGIYAITAETCELRYAYGLIATLTKGDVVITNQIHAVALELNTNRTYNSVIYLINTNSDTVHTTYLSSELLTRDDVADVAISGSYNDLINKPTFTNDIAIASSNTKYTTSPSAAEISLLNQFVAKTSNSTVRMRGCAYGNGIYVIVGTSGALQYSTDNAETWNIITAFTNYVIVSIAYGGGIFICVDSNGGIYKSKDCLTWSKLTSSITDIINAVVYVNGKFALVGANGLIAFSNDAKNFNVVTGGVSSELTSITRGLDKYVAVSTVGDILVSVNGLDWENKSVDTTHYRTVTFGKNIFVAGGQSGKIKYSTDATNWLDATNDSTSSVNYIRDIKYANGKFYAVMYISTGEGEIWESLDGATWKKTQTTAARLWCIGYGNDIFFTSGDNGAILVLNQNINWVDTQPIITKDEYIWSKEVYYLTDGSILEGEVEVYPELTNLEKKIPTIVTLTQTEYDALGTYDENTLYLIKEE